jgi:hypothetical protein
MARLELYHAIIGVLTRQGCFRLAERSGIFIRPSFLFGRTLLSLYKRECRMSTHLEMVETK